MDRQCAVSLALTFCVAACGTAASPGGGTGGGAQSAGGNSTAGVPAGEGGSLTGGSGNGSAGKTSAGAPGAAGEANTDPGPPLTGKPDLVTSGPNAYWQVGGTVTEVTSGDANVTVDSTRPAQTFTGFGGAINERGWKYLSNLSESDRAKALKLLFSANDGAKFAYARIPIGANDYAIDRYTLDETPGDTQMAKFSIDRDRMYLIPYIKAALAVNPDISFWASPWTPPTWMKDGGVNGQFDKGTMKEDDTTLAAYALYLARFVEEYAKEGINIRVLHPQNEPGYSQFYPSCGWSQQAMTKFIGSFLGPTFASRKLGTDIFMGTMSNANDASDPALLNAVMSDATAKGFIRGAGFQWGMIDALNGGKLQVDKRLPIWQTEHVCGKVGQAAPAPNDHDYGKDSWGHIRDWIKAGVNAYSAWNMVLDTGGLSIESKTTGDREWAQNALLTVDAATGKLNATPAYYVFRHVSQYVDAGASVLATTGGDALAFKNPDGSITTIIFNSEAAKTLTVAVGGRKLQFQIPGDGWATLIAK